MQVLCYARCSTCKKALQWLDDHGVVYDLRDIKLDHPSETELRQWHAKSGLPLKRFFNTSGRQYRALELKDRLPEMPENEQFTLLASDGMLVKRPLLIDGDTVLTGFREADWANKLL